jgi:hypothetical protein
VTLALWAAESKVHVVGIWSLDEVMPERRNQQPAEPELTEECAVSEVKRTPIMDMLSARRYAVSRQPDTSQYPTSPPDIGTPTISTETS